MNKLIEEMEDVVKEQKKLLLDENKSKTELIRSQTITQIKKIICRSIEDKRKQNSQQITICRHILVEE
jgi:hypothetical protein